MKSPDGFLGLVMVGRLGNHIGSLAAGLAFAWEHNLELKCPQLGNRAVPRHVDLILEPMKAEFLPETFYWPNMCAQYQPVYERLLAEYPGMATTIPAEKISAYHLHLQHAYRDIDIIPNSVLVGYFFNEQYFLPYKDRIKALFQPPEGVSAYLNHKYGNIIQDPKSVGIHYRDFANDGEKWVSKLSEDHFLDAVSQFDDTHTFYVCSNKIENAKLFFKKVFDKTRKRVLYIDGERDFIDFYFLVSLKNVIISNSSFGWWVGYLNMHSDKLIVAPARDKWVLPVHLNAEIKLLPQTESWELV